MIDVPFTDEVATAERPGPTLSNVDNRYRRGREKIEEARQVVTTLDALAPSGADESAAA